MPRRIIQNLLFDSRKFIGDRLSVRAKACYSLRRLYSDWLGFAIRVRKTVSSIDYFADIGFTSSGDLDIVVLLAFAESGDVFVHTKYDQSGNGYHEIQNTNASQPKIVVSGVLNLEGSRPALLLSGSQFLSTSNWSTSNIFGGSPMTMNLVGKSASASDQAFFSYGGATVLTLRELGGILTAWRSTTSGDISNNATNFQTLASVTNTWDGATSSLYTQGVLRGTSTGAENTNATELFIGQRSNSGVRAVGNFCEGWIFPATLPTSDLSLLHRDQGAYYVAIA